MPKRTTLSIRISGCRAAGYHGAWHRSEGDHLGIVPFGGHATSREFSRDIEAPFFRYYLHGEGTAIRYGRPSRRRRRTSTCMPMAARKPDWQVTTFQTGSKTLDHDITVTGPLKALLLRRPPGLMATLW